MRRLLLASLTSIVLLLAGCGDDGGGGDGSEETLSGAELVEVLTDAGLTAEQAECFAGEIGELSREDAQDPEVLIDRASDAGGACLDTLVDDGGAGDVPDLDSPDETIPDFTIPPELVEP